MLKKIYLFIILFINFLFSNEELDNFKKNVAIPIQENSNINIVGLMNDFKEYKESAKSLWNEIQDPVKYENFLISTCIKNIFLPGSSDSNGFLIDNDFEKNKLIFKKLILDEESHIKDNGIKNIKNFFNYCIKINEKKVILSEKNEFILSLSKTKEGQKTIYSSDLHSSILNFEKIISESFSTKEDCKIKYIFTGDYINKGISEIATFCGSLINMIMTSALNSSEKKCNFIFLKGNHEDIGAIERNNIYLYKMLKKIDLFNQEKNILEKIYPIANFNVFENKNKEIKLILESHHGQMLDKLTEKIDINEKLNFIKVKIDKDEKYRNHLYCWSDYSRINSDKVEKTEKNERPEIPFSILKKNICRNINEKLDNCLKLSINGHTHNDNIDKLFEKLINKNICLVKNDSESCTENKAPGFYDRDYIESKNFNNYIYKNEKNCVGLFLPCSCGLNLFGKDLEIKNNNVKKYYNEKFKNVSGILGYEFKINKKDEIKAKIIDLENNEIIYQLNNN